MATPYLGNAATGSSIRTMTPLSSAGRPNATGSGMKSSKAPLVEWPAGAQQVLLEKQSLDAFSNPQLPKFLEMLDPERFVVYGVVTEICVRWASSGLIRTGKRVELVTDAVRHLNEESAQAMMREFQQSGGVLVTTSQVCGTN